MSPDTLLNELETIGAHLSVQSGKLRLSAPKGTVRPELLTALRQHKAALLARLAPPPQDPEAAPPTAAEVAGLRLSQFKARRLAVLVRSTVLGEDVVFAADRDCVPAAWRHKPLYLADELMQLCGADPATLRELHRIKTTLGGVVLRHARRAGEGDAPR